MQAVRYFVAFKVVKAAESVFNAVTCCSGCFSAYRREAIMPHLDWWENQTFLGRPSTFGDDRSLTNCVLRGWKVRYESRAVSHTLVPDGFRQFMNQQLRWKRSWTRESLIVGAFIWRKNPVAAARAYVGMFLPLVAPIVAVRAPSAARSCRAPARRCSTCSACYAMAVAYGLYYAARQPRYDTLWIYGVAVLLLLPRLPAVADVLRDRDRALRLVGHAPGHGRHGRRGGDAARERPARRAARSPVSSCCCRCRSSLSVVVARDRCARTERSTAQHAGPAARARRRLSAAQRERFRRVRRHRGRRPRARLPRHRRGARRLSVSQRAFAEQMAALRAWASARSRSRQYAAFRARRHAGLPERPILITFDDGRLDSYRGADRVLERFTDPRDDVRAHRPGRAAQPRLPDVARAAPAWPPPAAGTSSRRPTTATARSRSRADGRQGAVLRRAPLHPLARPREFAGYEARVAGDVFRCATVGGAGLAPRPSPCPTATTASVRERPAHRGLLRRSWPASSAASSSRPPTTTRATPPRGPAAERYEVRARHDATTQLYVWLRNHPAPAAARHHDPRTKELDTCVESSDTWARAPARELLLSGLRALEYRGYDSAGLAVCTTTGRSTRSARWATSPPARGRAEHVPAAAVRRGADGHHGHRPHALGHARRA